MSRTFQPLLEPTFVTRPFVICLRYEHGKSVHPQDVIKVPEMLLIQLDDEVWVTAGDYEQVRKGQYLIGNPWLTERLGFDQHKPEQQVMMLYDGLVEAIAGAHRVRGKYRFQKLMQLDEFTETAEQLIWYAYDMTRFPELVAMHTSTAENWVLNYPTTEDPDVIAALEEMIDASDPTDVLGRRNPRRIPLMCFMIQRLVAQAKRNITGAQLPRVERHLLVLANRMDQLRKHSRELKRVAGNVLRSERTTGIAYDPSRWPTEADYLRTAAQEIREKVPDRPIVRCWNHTARNFDDAARALEQGLIGNVVLHLGVAERMLDFQDTFPPALLALRLDLTRMVHFDLPQDAVVRETLRMEGSRLISLVRAKPYDQGLTGVPVAAPTIDRLHAFRDRVDESARNPDALKDALLTLRQIGAPL